MAFMLPDFKLEEVLGRFLGGTIPELRLGRMLTCFAVEFKICTCKLDYSHFFLKKSCSLFICLSL